MFYSLIFLTALLSQLQGSSAASTQTRVIDSSGSRTSSMAAYNNLVVIGDGSGDAAGGSSGNGDISFSFYNYAISTDHTVSANDFVQATATTANGGATAATVTAAAATDLAGNTFKGLGHAISIADSETVFVSQTSISAQTGRVVLYKGNTTTFEQTQLLIPYDGKHRLDSHAAFGESISAKHDALAVGCQNCNTSAPIYSGAVYVYKPTKEGTWSETQTLTADGVLFLGERVAIHNSVLVAAGDDASGPGDYYNPVSRRQLATGHDFSNVANTVVVYEEGHHGHFEQRQVITTKSGSFRESISGLTVFDETIAITTIGTDLPSASSAAARDKVYIYYPMNKRYGLEPGGKPKPKPQPQQWTNIQILTSADVADVWWFGGSPDVSISMNTLQYLTTKGTNVGIASSRRSCLSCKFDVPTVTATQGFAANSSVMLTSDASSFYSFQTGDVDTIVDPVANSLASNCLSFALEDRYNDGWGIANLLITSPTGAEDRFTLQCTTANPHVFRYCPATNAPGKYTMRIEHEKEVPFAWEIIWKVSVGSAWYYGDSKTHMDVLWDEKYQDFHIGATHGLIPVYDTCQVCDPNKPAGKHRSLTNLRSLHHKGTTSSPTVSVAPTITATGYANTLWNEFTFVGTDVWFKDSYSGANFFISDQEGKHLHRTGTRCTAGTGSEKCWVDLPDGDYTLRVGSGTEDPGTSTLTYAFCESSNPLKADTELRFTILDQQCYAGLYTIVDNVCLNTLQAPWILNVDLLLSGSTSELTSSDDSTLKVAVSETLLSVLGSVPTTSSIQKQQLTRNGLKLSMLVEFSTLPDATAVDNFAKDTSSASSLLKYELIGSTALSSNFLSGRVSGVTIIGVQTDGAARDFSTVDESDFKTVSDHVWLTDSAAEAPSDNFNEYARYVAEGAYALVAVAAVLAVSLFAKRAMSKTTSDVVEDVKA